MVYHTHCFWRKNSLHRKWCVGVSSCSWIHRCFPGGSDGKASVCNAGDLGSTPGLGRRKWQPTPVFLPGKSHGQWSLVGYLPRGRKELDMTERDLLPFYSGPEAAGLIKQWNGLLRTEDQCPLVTIYCRVGAMFLGRLYKLSIIIHYKAPIFPKPRPQGPGNKDWNGHHQKSHKQQVLERMWRKGILLYCWWEGTLIQPQWRFLKKTRNKTTKLTRNSTTSHILWRNQSWKRHMTSMFTIALFAIARMGKQPRCPLTVKWVKKLWYIYQFSSVQ